eukprot:scaffold327347_cov53-Tisochrysis_lutea.AAC.1
MFAQHPALGIKQSLRQGDVMSVLMEHSFDPTPLPPQDQLSVKLIGSDGGRSFPPSSIAHTPWVGLHTHPQPLPAIRGCAPRAARIRPHWFPIVLTLPFTTD